MTDATYNPTFSNNNTNRTSAIWPIWRDSISRPVIFQPIPKQKARQTWFRARKWERDTHQKQKHGGIIGRTGLAVLYCLIHDFLNFRTGRLDPSVLEIARKAGVCERSVYSALKKLRDLGLIAWVRRCHHSTDAEGRFLLRQSTNAYHLTRPRSWSEHEEAAPPVPHGDTVGAHPPLATTLESASRSLATGNRSEALHNLTVDEADPLARALAQLGRAMGAL